MDQLIYIYNHEWILFSRTIGQLPQKEGKVKLPLFCGNAEQVIPIYGAQVYIYFSIASTRNKLGNFLKVFTWFTLLVIDIVL